MSESQANYDINTGKIFLNLQEKFEQYERPFLYHIVWPAYKQVIKSKGQISIWLYDDEENVELKNYLNKYKFRFKQEWESEDRTTGFPFPDYILWYEGHEVVGLTRFADDCILEVNDRQFDLFFTIQLLQTDIMEANAFFEYHFTKSYNKDQSAYSNFLKNVSYKYHTLFSEGNKLSLINYIERLLALPVEIVQEKDTSIKVEGFTLKRQVLIMYYLFKEVGLTINTTTKADMARLIQGLTGRQTAAKDITNTELYKRLGNPLKDDTKGGFDEDLRFVRDQFEKLSLQKIAQEISKEIQVKE